MSDKGGADGGASPSKSSSDGYQINKIVVWCAGVLAVVCLALAIALPLSLSPKENVIHVHSYATAIPPHDPFKLNIFDKWEVSDKAREAYRNLGKTQLYGQCQQFDWQSNQEGGEDPNNYIRELGEGNVGSLLNIQDAVTNKEIQEIATKDGYVPVIYANDTIHGHVTTFPVNIGMAAAWSPELIFKGTEVAAKESKNLGIRWTFAPNLDIGRDPRWGRVSEGSGEDPYLTGQLGVQYVRAFQKHGVAACIKHVTGYGLPIAGRDCTVGHMDLAEVLNVYLQAMKPAILESWTMMPSYSGLDGMPAHSYRFLFNDIIRGHWGWDGVVVSDYVAVRDLTNLWQAEDELDATRRGIYGGVDMSMSDGLYLWHLGDVAEEVAPDGRTYQEYAELSARRVIALKDRVGLFEEPDFDFDEDLFCNDEHMAIARETVRKSIVMVTNKDNTLPLADTADTNVLLVGTLADHPRHQIGSWPGRVFAEAKCYPDAVVTYREAFCENDGFESRDFGCAYEPGYTHPLYPEMHGVEAAQQNVTKTIEEATSGKHSHIIFFVGDMETMNGESTSRANLTLAGTQLNLMQDVHAAVQTMPAAQRPKLIAVFLTARANIMEWEVENLDAVLYGWVAGHQGGPGLRDVMFGDYDVTGRLPFTQPRNVGQIPIYYYQDNSTRDIFMNGVDCYDNEGNRYDCDTDYSGSVQYQSKYIDSKSDPRFVFGHGLHYNSYSLSNVSVGPSKVTIDDKIKVTGTVTKTGNVPNSAEIVQVYVRDDVRTYAPPNKLLKRFQRIEFDNPTDTTRNFEFEIDIEEDLGFYTPDLEYTVEKGTFTIYVGFHSADEANKFTVELV